VQLAAQANMPISWFVKPTIFNQFCGGETLLQCNNTVRELEKYNVKAILDYSVEGKDSHNDIKKAMQEILMSINYAANDPNIPFCVFKPTALVAGSILQKASANGLNSEEEIEAAKFKDRVNTLCKYAYSLNIPILVDAEDFQYQPFVDATILEMMKKYNGEKALVFNTLQMYRIDRLNYLFELIEDAEKNNFHLGLKFVRGAYMEKERERATLIGYESPIHPTKNATDRDFDAALTLSVDYLHRISIFCGSHNENSCLLLTKLMEENNIANNDLRIWFSQLYGMSDHISYNLAHSSYNVAKYIPYGPVKHVIPYLIRRAEENTSISGQTGRELELIKKEKKRRAQEKK